MGGRGTTGDARTTNSIEKAISNIEKNPIKVSREEIQDIKTTSYGLDVKRLSESDRKKLAEIIYNDNMAHGETANNSMEVVRDINQNAGVVQVNIGGLNSDQLKDFIRISSKIHSTSSTFAMEDAFKVLSYYRNGGSSRASMVDNERGWKYPEVTQNVTRLEKSLNSARSANRIQSISQALRKQDARITAEIERLHNGTADVKGSEKALLTERRRVRQLIKRAKI